MPIQIANRLFELFHFAPSGFGARKVLNWETWSTTDKTVGRKGGTSAASMVAPPEAKSNT